MNSVSGITTVLIAGGGTMGQEAAADCAMHGFDVRLFDLNPHAVDHAAETKSLLSQIWEHDPQWVQRRNEALRNLTIETDLAKAAEGVDLVIECIPERINLKRDLFHQLSRLCSPTTILATNTSVLLPSQIAGSVTHPERFAALHFLNESCTIEVMGHEGTDPEVIRRLELFSRQIGRRPVTVLQEQSGYLFNSMLMPVNHAALTLAANGVASVEDIDRVFMMGYGTSFGPFGSLDAIGLDSVLEITRLSASLLGDPQIRKNVKFLEGYVNAGRLGVKSKKGFYEYPNPAYKQPEFVAVNPLPGPGRVAPVRQFAMIEASASEPAGTFVAIVDPRNDGFWRDHVMKDTPLLPAAGMIEMVAEAAALLRPGEPTSLRNVTFKNGIRSFNGQPQKLFIVFEGDQFSVFQEFCNQSGKVIDPRRLCVTGSLGPAVPLPAPPSSWPSGVMGTVVCEDGGPHHLGPTMRGLRRVALGDHTGWGEISAQPMSHVCPARAEKQFVHSVPVIDAALCCCNAYTEFRLNGDWQIPVTIGTVQLGRAPFDGETSHVLFQAVQLSPDLPDTEYTLSVFGANGDCLFSMSGYRCHIMHTAERPGVHVRFENAAVV